MPFHPRGLIRRDLRALFEAGSPASLTDGQLLERFATRRGEPAEQAFAALVDRHGPMVLRACRGILRDDHEAMDSFQATFLVLARKGRSLWVGDSLGPWLHRVACRAANRARAEAARRRALERRLADVRTAPEAPGDDRIDLSAVLHEEVERLPERYRAAIVLCDLQGHTCEETARRLGCPVGTVGSRLSRGRERLRDRLARRGLAPTAGLISLALAREAVGSEVSNSLATAALRGALAFTSNQATAGASSAAVFRLSEDVTRSLIMAKIRSIAAGLAVACGASLLVGGALRGAARPQGPAGLGAKDRPSPAKAATKPSADGDHAREDEPALPDPARAELELMQGGWTRISTEAGGNKRVLDRPRPLLIIAGENFTFGVNKDGAPLDPERATLDPRQTPKAIDLTPTGDSAGPLKGKAYPGIYKIEGDRLILCLSIRPGSKRPDKFATAGNFWIIDIYKRTKPSAP